MTDYRERLKHVTVIVHDKEIILGVSKLEYFLITRITKLFRANLLTENTMVLVAAKQFAVNWSRIL
jgi:hypothetical protein